MLRYVGQMGFNQGRGAEIGDWEAGQRIRTHTVLGKCTMIPVAYRKIQDRELQEIRPERQVRVRQWRLSQLIGKISRFVLKSVEVLKGGMLKSVLKALPDHCVQKRSLPTNWRLWLHTGTPVRDYDSQAGNGLGQDCEGNHFVCYQRNLQHRHSRLGNSFL